MFIELTITKKNGCEYIADHKRLFNTENINVIDPPTTGYAGVGAEILECEDWVFVVESYEYIADVLRTTGNAIRLKGK